MCIVEDKTIPSKPAAGKSENATSDETDKTHEDTANADNTAAETGPFFPPINAK